MPGSGDASEGFLSRGKKREVGWEMEQHFRHAGNLGHAS